MFIFLTFMFFMFLSFYFLILLERSLLGVCMLSFSITSNKFSFGFLFFNILDSIKCVFKTLYIQLFSFMTYRVVFIGLDSFSFLVLVFMFFFLLYFLFYVKVLFFDISFDFYTIFTFSPVFFFMFFIVLSLFKIIYGFTINMPLLILNSFSFLFVNIVGEMLLFNCVLFFLFLMVFFGIDISFSYLIGGVSCFSFFGGFTYSISFFVVILFKMSSVPFDFLESESEFVGGLTLSLNGGISFVLWSFMEYLTMLVLGIFYLYVGVGVFLGDVVMFLLPVLYVVIFSVSLVFPSMSSTSVIGLFNFMFFIVVFSFFFHFCVLFYLFYLF